jgi:RNA polymerase sigma-70 factor, ECF subfamily
MIDAMPSLPADTRPDAPLNRPERERPEPDDTPGEAAAAAPNAATDPSDAALEKALSEQQWRSAALTCARQHGPAIGRLCLAMLGDRALAEEAAQDTLLAAYQSFPSYRREAPVRAWLLGIARKKCLRLREQRQRQLQWVAESPPPATDAEALLLEKHRAERARAALAEIRPTEREALLLRYQSGLSYEAIASVCAVDTAAARKRVSRGLWRLRTLITQSDEERGGSSPKQSKHEENT